MPAIPQTLEQVQEYLSLVKCWSMDNPQSRTDEWDLDLKNLINTLEDESDLRHVIDTLDE